jgi:DNA-binding transcriptional MocR family regulator
LREWIADHHGVTADNVLVTNGSMQAYALLSETLVMPGDHVVVEAPTYDRTLANLLHRVHG